MATAMPLGSALVLCISRLLEHFYMGTASYLVSFTTADSFATSYWFLWNGHLDKSQFQRWVSCYSLNYTSPPHNFGFL